MYNPYTLLTNEILDAMLRHPMHFVRQDYPRGTNHFDDKETKSFLLTHYVQKGDDYERAERHMRLLMMDKYRFLYDSENRENIQKLKIAASQPQGYNIYINLLPKAWKANDRLKNKINTYLKKEKNSYGNIYY